MATIPLNIPDELVEPCINALCSRGNYQPEVLDPNWVDPMDGTMQPMIPNPVSKAKFARKQLYRLLRDIMAKEYELETRVSWAEGVNAYRLTLSNIDEV